MLRVMLFCINECIVLELVSSFQVIEMLLDVIIFGFSFCDFQRLVNMEEERKIYFIVQIMYIVRQVVKSYWFYRINFFVLERLENFQ